MQELEGFAGAASLHTRADSTLDLLHSASSHFGSRARTQAHPIDCARAISHPKTHTYTLLHALPVACSPTAARRASAAFWYRRRRRIICSTARRGFCAFLWWGRSLKEPQERPVKAASHTLCTVKRRRHALAYAFAETGDWIGLTLLRTRQPARLTTNHILTPARLDLSTSYSD